MSHPRDKGSIVTANTNIKFHLVESLNVEMGLVKDLMYHNYHTRPIFDEEYQVLQVLRLLQQLPWTKQGFNKSSG